MSGVLYPSFLTPPDAPRVAYAGLSAPACLLAPETAAGLAARDGLASVDVTIDTARGVIDAIAPAGALADPGDGSARVETGGAIALPGFVDMHTHLDKGHIWGRAPNPDGTFGGALDTVGADRRARWSAEDVRARMSFALESAYAHGTRAIRTHLDSLAPQEAISWPVFEEIRSEWADRIALQAVSLIPIDLVEDSPFFLALADRVATAGGVLGAVAYPMPDLDARLDLFFRTAAARGLDADFHVDETGDPSSAGLRAIAEAKIRAGFEGRVICGHCCSLAVQDESEAERTMDLVAEAGIAVVSLPMCNLYLQGRGPGRTPRWRGVTLVHELSARGVPVAFASDNTRDPFYAYGDLDMIEVMREATRIAHLDHGSADWPAAFSTTPAQVCGFAEQRLEAGAPADLVLCAARGWSEFYARPQADRVVLRRGRPIEQRLPDYARLDALSPPG